jgi:hypothetical protein
MFLDSCDQTPKHLPTILKLASHILPQKGSAKSFRPVELSKTMAFEVNRAKSIQIYLSIVRRSNKQTFCVFFQFFPLNFLFSREAQEVHMHISISIPEAR